MTETEKETEKEMYDRTIFAWARAKPLLPKYSALEEMVIFIQVTIGAAIIAAPRLVFLIYSWGRS